MIDDVNDFGKPPINCTANDTKIALVVLTQVNGQDFNPEEDPPFVCNGPDVTIGVRAQLQTSSQENRADVGVWVATDGGDAKTGQCNHYIVPPGSDPNAFNDDDDECAGIAEKSEVALFLGALTVPCQDTDNDGFLDLSGCIAWDVPGQDGVCPDDRAADGATVTEDDFRAATIPGTPAKCNCSTFNVPVVIPKKASLEVKKVCDPTTITGRTFDLLIDGGTADEIKEDNAACGGTTDKQEVSAGTNADPGADHTFSEADFTTADFVSSYKCTDRGSTTTISQCGANGDAACSGSGTGPTTINVQPEDDIVCTFTNQIKSGLTIIKNTVPDDEQDFAFTTSGTGLSNFSLDDDADNTLSNTKSFTGLTPGGSRTVTETAVSGFDLTNIACTGATSSTVQIGSDADFDAGDNSVSVGLAPGENVSCTFTNTKRGSIIIEKQTDPDGATGSFGFTHNVGSNSDPTVTTPFSLSDGGQQTFLKVKPSTSGYTVTESDPTPGFDLYQITCDDGSSTTPSTTSVANRQAVVKVDAGETVKCTFYNRQRATVTLNKRESGALPLTHAWGFEIRTGASTSAAGTVVATGTANTTTGVVTFACSPNPNSVCGNVSGVANLKPGDYQLCETGMPAGWSNNFDGFTPLGATPEGGDNSTECKNITLTAGGSGTPSGIPDPIDNTPPPGGDARTIGYWKNWASCAASSGKQYEKAVANGDFSKTLDGNLPQLIGDLNITTCPVGVLILNKSDINSKKKKANDAAYGLAAQLLAAKLNVSAGAGTCTAATNAIAGGQALLDAINFNGTGNYLTKASADRTAALNYATILDNYNNNNLCP
jgi:hypothetical protein